MAALAYLLQSVFFRSALWQRMDGTGAELGAGGFGLGEFGFQGVAQAQQLGDLGDDSLLLQQRRNRNRDRVHFGLVHLRLSRTGDMLFQVGRVDEEFNVPNEVKRDAVEHMRVIVHPRLALRNEGENSQRTNRAEVGIRQRPAPAKKFSMLDQSRTF